MARRKFTIFVCHASGHPTDELPHGDGLLALSFIRCLAENGHTLHVAVDQSSIRMALPRNVFLHQLNNTRRELNPLVHMFRSRSLLNRLRQTVRFDLIHQLNPAFTGLSLAMAGSTLPCVIGPYAGNWLETSSFSPLRALKQSVRMKIRYWQQQQAAAILVWNHAAVVNIKTTGALNSPQTAGKLFVVPPGIDTEAFRPCYRPSGDRPVILFLANIVKRKGIFTLLEAFERVANEHSTCELHVAGDGPELPQARHLAGKSVHSSRIRFLGAVQRSAVPSVLHDCDIYCLPSYGEPFGMTALEAMACGKPVVVTDAGGLTELVSAHGGRKAHVGDPQSLAAALLMVLASDGLRASMGEVNRRTAVDNYSWPKVIDRLEDVYDNVVAEKPDPESVHTGFAPIESLKHHIGII